MKARHGAFRRGFLLLALAAAVLLSACAPSRTTLYHWEKYQPTLYQYYQKDKSGTEEQIAALEETLEKARAKDRVVPPGLHAHLGLLYADNGKGPEAMREFETEKTLFPESAPFMDFFLNRQKGNKP